GETQGAAGPGQRDMELTQLKDANSGSSGRGGQGRSVGQAAGPGRGVFAVAGEKFIGKRSSFEAQRGSPQGQIERAGPPAGEVPIDQHNSILSEAEIVTADV